MKILVVCQYYYPEPFRISDTCEELVKRGHEVTVVTGVPNYPEGKVYDGYQSGRRRREVINGVQVRRCFTIGRRHGTLFRFLNYFSYAISSSLYVRRLRQAFDVVLVHQLSPVMMANAAITHKKKYGTPMVLYCLDLWPESLVVGGIKKGSAIYKVFHKISKRIYSKADKILVSSRMFSQYFRDEFGIEDTTYLPQYAEAAFDPATCKKEPNGMIDVMFAGNVGTAQSMETIIYAADKTKDIANLRWHIVGDGSELRRIKDLCQTIGAHNVVFHGRQPLDAMPRYYSMADAMLVTMQKNDVLSMTLPGKVQTYLAAGKPLLGAIDGETAALISEAQCGLSCSAEDAEGLADIARRFVDNYATQQYGDCAENYYKRMFSKDAVLDQLMQALSNEKSENISRHE